MSTFFDFKTINELIGDNYYRQPKEFTLEDLSQYNESNGVVDILANVPKAGFLIDGDYMSDINNMNCGSTMPTNRQIKQDTSKFTPDDWIRYIAPLVTYALRETTQEMDRKRAYQKFILLGVLVGLGKTPQEAISQVQEWQNTGTSQLLKSGTSIGGTSTSGSMGTGGTSGTSTSGSMGTGGTSGTSTSGIMGTGGTSGTSTSGSMGTGGTSGTSTSGSMGTGGTSGTSTSGSMGTGGTSGTSTSGSMGTGGTSTSGSMGTGGTSTSGSMGTGGTSGTSTSGSPGTVGTGIGGSTGTSSGTGTSGSTRIEESVVLPPYITTFKFVSSRIDI